MYLNDFLIPNFINAPLGWGSEWEFGLGLGLRLGLGWALGLSWGLRSGLGSVLGLGSVVA